MTSAITVLAAQQVTAPSSAWLPVLIAAVTSAGFATIVVSIVRGIWVRQQINGPRSRVQAIKEGAETLNLLSAGSEAFRAVEAHVRVEVRALQLYNRRDAEVRGSVVFGYLPDGESDIEMSISDPSVVRSVRGIRLLARIMTPIAGVLAVGVVVAAIFAPTPIGIRVMVAVGAGAVFGLALWMRWWTLNGPMFQIRPAAD